MTKVPGRVCVVERWPDPESVWMLTGRRSRKSAVGRIGLFDCVWTGPRYLQDRRNRYQYLLFLWKDHIPP